MCTFMKRNDVLHPLSSQSTYIVPFFFFLCSLFFFLTTAFLISNFMIISHLTMVANIDMSLLHFTNSTNADGVVDTSKVCSGRGKSYCLIHRRYFETSWCPDCSRATGRLVYYNDCKLVLYRTCCSPLSF